MPLNVGPRKDSVVVVVACPDTSFLTRGRVLAAHKSRFVVHAAGIKVLGQAGQSSCLSGLPAVMQESYVFVPPQ